MAWIELVASRPEPLKRVQPPEMRDWYTITNLTEDESEVLLYDEIGGWFGTAADQFVNDLKAITARRMTVRINSPGGSVFEGIAIANALRAHPAHITVYVDALAASIASVIALAGDRVVMMPSSQLMIHDASGVAFGNAEEMQKMADLLDKQSDNIAQAYSDRAEGSAAFWRDLMREETWFTASEAVDAGLADEVFVPPEREEEPEAVPQRRPREDGPGALMSRVWDLSMFRYAGRDASPEPPSAVAEPVVPEAGAVLTARDGLSFDDLLEAAREAAREVVRAELAVVEGAISPSHSTAVREGTWDAGVNEKRLPSPVPVATVKKMYTFYDADEVENGAVPKSACKLPHHFVSEDGSPGAASVNGVRNALARLPQTQGLTEAERSAAETHLRKHLSDFGGDEEDRLDEGAVPVEDLAASPPPDNADRPPFHSPEEEEEEPEEEEEMPKKASAAHVADDVWSSAFARLTQSSPSADDAFNAIKEAWL